MPTKSTIHCLSALLLGFVSITAKAEIQKAHVHGLATLNLALENEVMEIHFESPAANVIGFEHKARSAKEKQAVEQTKTVLKSPKLMFSFVGTDCELKATTVDISEVVDSEHEHHSHSENHSHSEHHKHSEHHNHSSGHHSEIKSSYRFNCKDAGDLNYVSIGLFELFPGIEKINVLWVTETKQGAELLAPGRNKISLR